MTYLKKVLLIFLATFFAVTIISGTAVAQPKTLYETSSHHTITDGATLEHISRFTADGWLNINVLRIDTTNPNIKIDTLANSQTTDLLSTVLTLAEENGAVAAVNASFFNPMDGGTGYPDGPIVRAGDLLATSGWYNQNNDEMASLSLDNAGQILFNYWKNALTLTSNNASFAVAQYNQPSRQQYNDITMLDNKWGSATLGTSEKYPDLVEILVSQGRVIEIRQALPAATIPAKGYVVISRGEQAVELLESFKVGDPAKFTVTSNPDWSELQMSATGSSMLVKDGQIPETFSLSTDSLNNKNPRTLVGSSAEGKQLILVTVDGRQDNSVGLTQTESAQLMQELGAYNALNFDGGGSTTMVSRKTGTATLDIVNIPSEGSLRPVASGIGVFSQVASGSLAKLILETEDSNVFVHTSRKYTLRGVDRFANPVEVNPEKIKWSVSGIEGRFRDNQFQPTSAGKGKITAKVGKLTAELDILSLNSPVKLGLNSDKLDLPLGQSQTLQVTGYDQQGFKAKIQPEDVQWAVSGEIEDFKEGILKATTVGAGYIEAGVGNVNAYIAVSIYEDSTDTIYSFEDDQASFQANPQIAQGAFQLSTDQVKGGNTSGQLAYDFLDNQSSGEASLVFPGTGLSLDSDTSHLAVWIYNTHENPNRVFAEVLDDTGEKNQFEIAAKLDWIGWKSMEVSLERIKTPTNLVRLYVQNTDPAESWGKLYFDELTAKVVNHPVIDQSEIPQDTILQDDANRTTDFISGPESFKFSVFASRQESYNTIEEQLLNKMSGYISENLDLAVYTGSQAASSVRNMAKPALITETEHKIYNYKNSSFIQLDISKGGLRRSDPEQWLWLFEELDNMTGSNAFVVMSDAPATFINAKEGDLLKDTLAEYREKTGKNVWVLFQGDVNQSELDRGVRYISCAGFSISDFSPEKPTAAKYLEVTVMGNDITYEFKDLLGEGISQ
ncbi:phosphodiester glycosidase family protein [Desulfosporosinus fructosivorans]|uniref:Phosphodiester glycosidase family protein n=1 Tax=Desulfosporosinus fructosivorans TaxID=2018669 RepID=A0A4Z0QYH4_9FIRM|nr:phosphodiester glycosidase family protein [Desulfosporosinus fructosivorans]TGE35568.1 phosphodiester glycosidase family protein [Desulfosporosinus fructosivorans]